MNEPALIRAARDGDQHAAGELALRYERLGFAVARGFYVPGMTGDDIDQEVRYALLRAVEAADPDRPFAPFAAVAVRRWLITLIKHEQRDRRRANHHTLQHASTDDDGLTDLIEALPDTRALGPEEHLLWREEIRRLAAGIANLSDIERRAIVGLASGLSYSEIEGQPPGAKPKRVDNAIQRARAHLREAA